MRIACSGVAPCSLRRCAHARFKRVSPCDGVHRFMLNNAFGPRRDLHFDRFARTDTCPTLPRHSIAGFGPGGRPHCRPAAPSPRIFAPAPAPAARFGEAVIVAWRAAQQARRPSARPARFRSPSENSTIASTLSRRASVNRRLSQKRVGHQPVFVLAVAPGRGQVVVVIGRQVDGGVQHLADRPVRVLGIAAKTRAGRQARERQLFRAQRLRLAMEQFAQAVQALDGVGAAGRVAAGGPVAAGRRARSPGAGLVEQVVPFLVQLVAAGFAAALMPVTTTKASVFSRGLGERLLERRLVAGPRKLWPMTPKRCRVGAAGARRAHVPASGAASSAAAGSRSGGRIARIRPGRGASIRTGARALRAG
jgi:hypothetical protein